MPTILDVLYSYRLRTRRNNAIGNQEVWTSIIQYPHTLWYLTGETPESIQDLCDDLSDMDAFDNIPINFITNRDALLMTLIWIRQYPLLEHIAKTFYTTASTCHKIIWHCLIQLHILLANEIQWHNDADWMQLTGKYEDFISLATMID